MRPGFGGEQHLGADAIGGGDQHRVAKAAGGKVEQAAEAAQSGRGPGARGSPGKGCDLVDQPRAGIDVDAGLGIATAGW